MSEKVVIARERGGLYCTVCEDEVCGEGEKATKQHLRSRPHKNALKGRGKDRKSKRHEKKEEEEDLCSRCVIVGVDHMVHASQLALSPSVSCVCSSIACEMARSISSSHPLRDSLLPSCSVCLPPPLILRPRKQHLLDLHPFLTPLSASIDSSLSTLQQCVSLTCVNGLPFRLPNVDIEGEHIQVDSFSHARHLLLSKAAKCSVYWSAFSFDFFSHPEWWPNSHHVPSYEQVIVSKGAADIGIHFDSFGCEKTPVSTYLSLLHGRKIVLMLPPEVDVDALRVVVKELSVSYKEYPNNAEKKGEEAGGGGEQEREGEEDEAEKEEKKEEKNVNDRDISFPMLVSPSLVQHIKELGGYFFTTERTEEGDPLTLFVPKRWHHWLVNLSDWSVFLSSSRF